MAYDPPPHYNFGGPSDPQRPHSVPPAYSPQPPADAAYVPQQPVSSPVPPGPPQGIPTQPMYATQALMQPPPPGPGKSPMVPLLAVGMVVGLAGAAVGIALWLRAGNDLEDAEAQTADRNEQISQLEEDLEAAQTEAGDLETQVGELETQISELQGAGADAESMQACLDALNTFFDTAPDSAEEDAALIVVETDCAGWIS